MAGDLGTIETDSVKQSTEEISHGMTPPEWLSKPDFFKVTVEEVVYGSDPVYLGHLEFGGQNIPVAVKAAVSRSKQQICEEDITPKALTEEGSANKVREAYHNLFPLEPVPLLHYRTVSLEQCTLVDEEGNPVIVQSRSKGNEGLQPLGFSVMERIPTKYVHLYHNEKAPGFLFDPSVPEDEILRHYDSFFSAVFKIGLACVDIQAVVVDKFGDDVFYCPEKGRFIFSDWDVVRTFPTTSASSELALKMAADQQRLFVSDVVLRTFLSKPPYLLLPYDDPVRRKGKDLLASRRAIVEEYQKVLLAERLSPREVLTEAIEVFERLQNKTTTPEQELEKIKQKYAQPKKEELPISPRNEVSEKSLPKTETKTRIDEAEEQVVKEKDEKTFEIIDKWLVELREEIDRYREIEVEGITFIGNIISKIPGRTAIILEKLSQYRGGKEKDEFYIKINHLGTLPETFWEIIDPLIKAYDQAFSPPVEVVQTEAQEPSVPLPTQKETPTKDGFWKKVFRRKD